MIDPQFKTIIESQGSWLITTHKGPDGDAVGSVVAWAAFARLLQKDYLILFPDQPAAYLCPFLSDYNWAVFSAEANYQYDVLFALDYNASNRVGSEMSQFLTQVSAVKVMLDHHPGPDTFCDVMISQPTACSTTEVIYQTLRQLNMHERIDLAMAQGLYLGLLTDTGSFRFPSVSAMTHQMVAHLLEIGLVHHLIHEAVYDVNSVTRLQLRGYAIAEKLILLPDLQIGILTLSREELQRFNYQKGDTEGLVNVILSIDGYNCGVFLMETDEGVKLSFRSKGERYVNSFAQKYFEGGGHQYAAGGFSKSGLEQTLQRLNSLLTEL